LREWTAEQVGIDGELGRPMRTICTFFVPPGLPVEGKRQLVKKVSSALAEACDPPQEEVSLPSGKKVNTRWVLGFFSDFRRNVSWANVVPYEDKHGVRTCERSSNPPW